MPLTLPSLAACLPRERRYAYDSIGSSSRGCSEEYRGTGAFSEPETQAIRAVVQKHAPKAILHWHGWGNDIAFPYSYDWRAPMSNEDLGMYQEFAAEMAASNHYASGRAWESVGYTTNGEADDWGWGDHHAVSVTIEVGSSSDGFWPPPSRILPIAQESAWPTHYLAWAAGPMLQVDTLSLAPNADGKSAELRLALQNNGLGSYDTAHFVCLHAAPPNSELAPSAGWQADTAAGGALTFGTKACVTLPALGSRSYRTLPPMTISWSQAQKWISLTLTAHPPELSADEATDLAAAIAAVGVGSEDEPLNLLVPAGRKRSRALMGSSGSAATFAAGTRASASRSTLEASVPTPITSVANAAPLNPSRTIDAFRVRVHNSPSTLRGCDELCLCSSADNAHIDFSHECRAAVAPGSHCKVAKPAHAGSNWASGVIDEHFHFVATSYSKGGRCTVGSSKRDTLLAVYAACSRFGSQSPVGFANSEGGRTATVSFPCTAGTSYYLFWNAEYMPGRFAFTVSETCGGGDCVRAHRMRHLLRQRQKKRRRAMK